MISRKDLEKEIEYAEPLPELTKKQYEILSRVSNLQLAADMYYGSTCVKDNRQ